MTGHHETHEIRDMRKEFARLIAKDPESFAKCIKEYAVRGASAFPLLNTATAGSKAVPHVLLAGVLAEYNLRGSVPKDEWLSKMADKGVKGGDRYAIKDNFNDSTLNDWLKMAQKLFRSDPEFAEKVELFEFFFSGKVE